MRAASIVQPVRLGRVGGPAVRRPALSRTRLSVRVANVATLSQDGFADNPLESKEWQASIVASSS